MGPVAVIHHLDRPFLGQVAPPLRALGLELRERDRRRGDALPELDEVGGIVSLGGEQGVPEIEDWPELVEEAAWLREATARGVPVLGVCLGGQLLSHALGGVVTRGRRSVGWRALRPTVHTATDPLFGALPDVPAPGLHWNQDVFTLPPGGVELMVAEEADGVEAFRAGECSWGVQFHPDADRDGLDGWYERFGSGWLADAGVEELVARARDDELWEAHERTARAIFTRFGEVVLK